MKISIGIPTFNAGDMLLDAIRSVLAQTFTDWELIIVDDGSTDGTVNRIQNLRDPRIRILFDGTNRGLIFRLNQITQESRGEFMARMDADDMMHPARLETQLAFFEKHPDVDVLGTGICSIDQKGQPIGIRDVGHFEMNSAEVLERGGIIHPTIIARRDWFLRNPYSSDYPRAEDRELWTRTLLGGSKFGRIGEPLFFYREVNVQMRDKYLKGYESTRKVLRVYGPKLVGLFRTLMFLSRSHLKGMLLRLLFACDAQGLLFEKRCGRRLSEAETKMYSTIIDTIRKTSLPGINEY